MTDTTPTWLRDVEIEAINRIPNHADRVRTRAMFEALNAPGSDLFETLDALLAEPIVTKIEAPSTVVSQLRAACTQANAEAPPMHPIVGRPGDIPIEVNQELPMRTVRYHFSDGTTKMEKLG